MVRILTLSDKKFIESQRALGVSCQAISEELGVQRRLVYKWTALINHGQISVPQGRPVKGVGSSFEPDLLETHSRLSCASSEMGRKSQSPFPTLLHLWLLGLGVDLEWSRVYRPTDQAKVERTHQTLHDQIKQATDFKSWQDFKQTLDERRHRLNSHIVCDTLGKPPLVAFAEAKHSGRFFNPLTEQLLFDNKRIKNYLNNREWFRKIRDIKTVSLGGCIYISKT